MTAAAEAAARQAQLLKPRGSLGRLEEIAVWLAGITGDPRPVPRARIVIAAADHGVAAEGVSAYPQDVTAQMLAAFTGGGSAVSAMARHLGVEVTVVDAGVLPHSHDVRRIGLSPSANLSAGPALSEDEIAAAIAAGRALAAEARASGANLLIGGEMGIANTTPAACITAWLTNSDPDELVGRGTGIDDETLARKRDVARRALVLHGATADPHEALRRLGGGDIALLCGLALGAREHGLGYLCDGVIATSAVAVAAAIDPEVRSHLLAGHRSPEPAHRALLDHLGLRPLLELDMRLGEATGAVAALMIVQLACAVHDGMATFAEAGISGRS